MWLKLGKLIGKGAIWLAKHPEMLQGLLAVVKKAEPQTDHVEPEPTQPQ